MHGHKSCRPSRSLVERNHIFREVYRTSFKPDGVAVPSLWIHSLSALNLWNPDHPIRDSRPEISRCSLPCSRMWVYRAWGLRFISYKCCLRRRWSVFLVCPMYIFLQAAQRIAYTRLASRFWTSVLMERKKVLLYPLILSTLKRILVAVCTLSILVQILLNLNIWDFTIPLYVCLG